MSVPEIVDLKSVVEPHLNGGELQSYNARYLTKPGDNYGSCMLAITVKIKQPNGLTEELPLIAKLPPLTNDLFWQLFQPERTCITENKMYEIVVPEIYRLQLEAGISKDKLFDGLPKYYGSRISLDPNATKVDRDAVLVQENLQVSGYRAGNRHQMFDFVHAKLALEYMAQYHALPIALRIKKTEVFVKKIRPYFNRFNIGATMDEQAKEELQKGLLEDMQLVTNNSGYALDDILKMFELSEAWSEQPEAADGLYTSLVHCDLWINNIMFKYDDKDQPTTLKFVDFQIAQYESFVHDIIFFLFSSVEANVLEDDFEKLLKIYHDAFIQILKEVHIPTAEYSYEGFMNEVRRVAPIEIPHAIAMTKVILADNSMIPTDFKDLDLSVLSKNCGIKTITKRMSDILRLAKKFNLI